jgi:MarR family transcriptional regulator, temperature-dependent positive regulator of motility
MRTDMSATTRPGSILLVTRLSKAVYRVATEDVLGMKLKAFSALGSLREGPLPQKDLCVSTHLDQNNCVLLLNEMEAAGHVRRVRDPEDRRRHIVEITPEGKAALKQAERAMEDLEDEVLGALSPDERETLRGLLDRALNGVPAEQPA